MNEKDTKHIIESIKQRRLELGYSYQDLANKTGISKSTLQRYETGFIRNISIDKLEILAKALDLDPSYLMGWENNLHSFNCIIEKNHKKYSNISRIKEKVLYSRPHILSSRYNFEHLYQAVDLLTPYLVKKGYSVALFEKGNLGKIVASLDKEIWHLDFYLPIISEQTSNKQRLQIPAYSTLLQLYGKIVAFSEPVTKYTLVVNNEYIIDNFLKKKPHNLSIKTSLLLIDLKNNSIIKEVNL